MQPQPPSTAYPLAQQVSDRAPKFVTALIEAKTKAASGNPAEATKALQTILTETSRNRYLPFEFEIRLALGAIELKTGRADAGRTRMEALEKDANAKGFLRIARKARAARA